MVIGRPNQPTRTEESSLRDGPDPGTRVPRAPDAWRRSKKAISAAAWIAALGILVELPAFGGSYWTGVLTVVLVMGIASCSATLLDGQIGLASLGQGALFGVGGYISAIVAQRLSGNVIIDLLLAVVGSTLVALIIGLVIGTLSGVNFTMVTIALSAMFYQFVSTGSNFLGGANGIVRIEPTYVDLGFVEGGITESGMYYYILGMGLVTIGLAFMVRRSRLGLTWSGIRENARRMRALGYSVYTNRVIAFTLCGGLAGASGALLEQSQGFISPESVSFVASAEIYVMALLGRIGSPVGAFVGAGIVYSFSSTVSNVTPRWQSLLGVVVILAVYLTIGSSSKRRSWFPRLGGPRRAGSRATDQATLGRNERPERDSARVALREYASLLARRIDRRSFPCISVRVAAATDCASSPPVRRVVGLHEREGGAK